MNGTVPYVSTTVVGIPTWCVLQSIALISSARTVSGKWGTFVFSSLSVTP